MRRFRFFKQLNAMDCGATCLRMIAYYHGRHYSVESIRQISAFDKEGASLLGINDAAEKIGFQTNGVQLTYEELISEVDAPCILHWGQNHFVVMLPGSKRKKKNIIRIADPAQSILSKTKENLLKHWISSTNVSGEPTGIALLLEPTSAFYEKKGEKSQSLNWYSILQYLKPNRWQIIQVFIALLITSLMQLIFPFLTQSIVDIGINTQNLSYIAITLMAQLMLVFSRSIVDFIRIRLLLNVSIVVNLSILSDFMIKLTQLPLSYFDSRHTGDTLQRIRDNKQIQNFLTGSAVNTFFSFFSFIMFGIALSLYSIQLLLIFITGSILYFIWIRYFLRIRRKINYETFSISSKENDSTLQLIQGMQEVRLNNAEEKKRWEWEDIQAGLARLSLKSLSYNQIQQAGALFINQGKDIAITFTSAYLVIQGHLTLGSMLAVQYIIGQLSNPIEQFIGFMQTLQDARISMERLNEVQRLKNEESDEVDYINYLPEDSSIQCTDLTFSYPGAGNPNVLDNINLTIPQGKVTAIVGTSGSGKTTLIKILLKFYETPNSEIKIGNLSFGLINPSFWRKQCAAVLQDGYIFNDTISGNIAVSDEEIDHQKLLESCKIANILPYIESLPNGFNTKLGTEGTGLSQGQKQRLLIARAVYKNPEYFFFDEATNALDANNERAIVKNLQEVFNGKTVIVVAHRLSTVKNADKIIVLEKGRIVEEGTHMQLVSSKGKYYELIKNQLELGN